jgi:hypothetical protein
MNQTPTIIRVCSNPYDNLVCQNLCIQGLMNQAPTILFFCSLTLDVFRLCYEDN